MPGFSASRCASHGMGPSRVRSFYLPKLQPSKYTISGITKDSAGAALGACNVEVYETVSKMIRAATVSDANGVWSVEVTGGMGLVFFAVAYKVGSPDVAGTTVNTLVSI